MKSKVAQSVFVPLGHKVCSRKGCHAKGEPQPLEAFWIDRRRRDGRNLWCRRCRYEARTERGKHGDEVPCPECGLALATLGKHLREVHGLTRAEVRKRWPEMPLISDSLRAIKRDQALDQFGFFIDDANGGEVVRSIWDRDAMLRAGRRWVRKYGRPPTQAEWSSNRPVEYPAPTHLRRTFGSWNTYVIEIGGNPRPPHGVARWTQERIIAAFQREHAKTGRVPTMIGWKAATSKHPSSATVIYQFGSWNAGVEAAALPTRPPGFPKP
jgi:hypothetical protein